MTLVLFLFLSLIPRLVSAKSALIVFKRGSSGSTWFADLLRHASWCGHFVAEANTCVRNETSSQELLTWMRETLVVSTNVTRLKGKPKCTATKLDWWHEDKMVGFSIEPESSNPVVAWASYANLLALPRTWAVFYVRTNIVKYFVAKEHKHIAFNTICGTSKSLSAEARDCIRQHGITNERFAVDAAELVKETYRLATAYARMLATLKSLPTRHAPVVVTYEALQLDPAAALRSLAEIVGLRAPSFDTVNSSSIKITSNDLRRTISNFDELSAALRRGRHPQLNQLLRETMPIAHAKVCLFAQIDPHQPRSSRVAPQSECDSLTIGE